MALTIQRIVTFPKMSSAPFYIFLSQTNRRNSGSSYTNQGAERDKQVHQRESNGKSGDGQRTYSMSDKDTVDDIVQ